MEVRTLLGLRDWIRCRSLLVEGSVMNRLEQLFESILGVEPAGAGQDTGWEASLPRLWPSWLVLAFLIAAAGYFYYLYRREGTLASPHYKLGLTVLRWLLVLLVVLMLAEMDLRINRRGLPYIAVVIDDSASMSISDRYPDAKIE